MFKKNTSRQQMSTQQSCLKSCGCKSRVFVTGQQCTILFLAWIIFSCAFFSHFVAFSGMLSSLKVPSNEIILVSNGSNSNINEIIMNSNQHKISPKLSGMKIISDTAVNISDWDGISQIKVRSFNQESEYSNSTAIKATVIILTTALEKDIENLMECLLTLEGSFYSHNKVFYPITIFHESDLNEKLMKKLSMIIKSVIFYFVEIHFWIPKKTIQLLEDNVQERHWTAHPVYDDMNSTHKILFVHMHGIHRYIERRDTHPFGYFHMCRFWMSLQKVPHMQQYSYYMRLDTDSICDYPIPDYFSEMKKEDVYYLFNEFATERTLKVMEDMWNVHQDFLRLNDKKEMYAQLKSFSMQERFDVQAAERKINTKVILRCIIKQSSSEWWNDMFGSTDNYSMTVDQFSDKYCNGEYGSDNNTCKWQNFINIQNTDFIKITECKKDAYHEIPSYATNFEVVDLEHTFRTELYNAFVDFVDNSGGFYQFRYGDAPLRWMILSSILLPNQIKKVEGCEHMRK